MKKNKMLSLFLLINTAIVMLVGGTTTFFLYKVAVRGQEERLVETSMSQAKLIEAIARFNSKYKTNFPNGVEKATISQITDAHSNFKGFGETGEITLAKRVGDNIVFILSHRHSDLANPKPVPFNSKLAEPMRQALRGNSGTLIGLDYRGEKVIAAYEPVEGLDLGLVVKIDLSEIQRPFMQAGLLNFGFAILAVLVGTSLFWWMFNHFTESLQKSEKSLRQSEERIRTITDSVPVLISYVNAELCFRFNNKTYNEWFGKQPKELEGIHIKDVLGTTVYEQILPKIEAVLAGKEQIFEMEAPYKDGGSRFVQAHYVPHFGNDKEVLGFYTAIMDITQRKKVEEELKVSQRMLQTVFDTIPHTLAVKDVAGRYIKVNKAWCDMYDVLPESALHKTAMEIPKRPKEERINILEDDQKLFSGENSSIVIEHLRTNKDGEKRFLQNIRSKIKNEAGDTVGLVAIALDITERKEAEEKLAVSQRLLETVFDAIPLPLVVKDKDSNYLMVNRALAASYDLTPEDFIGRNTNEVATGTQQDRSNFLKSDRQAMETGEHVHVPELQVTLSKKEKRLRRVTKVPLFDDAGNVEGVVGVSEDITEQKMLEEQVRQAQKMDALGTLAGGIAHDFNNILYPMIGFTNLVMEKLHQDSEEYGNLKLVLKSAHRAEDLVQQILLFSRRSESLKASCDLKLIGQEVVNFFRATFPKSITFQVDISQKTSLVFGNRSQLHQLMMNLGINARQAMPDGGNLEISLRNVELEGAKVVLGNPLTGKHARFALTDNGVGMDKETLSQIFDPFFTTREVGKGTGLGLSTVFGIVQNHAGGIAVSTEPGMGTTFEVFLPLAEGSIKNLPDTRDLVQDVGTENILFIDDEEAITELGKIFLERFGYNVTAASNGKKALEIFAANPERFNLVVTDQSMPQMTGVTLAHELRKLRPDIPIILCTGHSEAISPESSKAIGISRFLYKPIAQEELGRVVREVLDQAKEVSPKT